MWTVSNGVMVFVPVPNNQRLALGSGGSVKDVVSLMNRNHERGK
jgi:hypothetical protein